MKITVKQLKEMIKQEFENVLLEGKDKKCPECGKADCECPKNEEKNKEDASASEDEAEACIRKCEKLKGPERRACGKKCVAATADKVVGSIEKVLAEPAKESIEEQIVAKVLEALQ